MIIYALDQIHPLTMKVMYMNISEKNYNNYLCGTIIAGSNFLVCG